MEGEELKTAEGKMELKAAEGEMELKTAEEETELEAVEGETQLKAAEGEMWEWKALMKDRHSGKTKKSLFPAL